MSRFRVLAAVFACLAGLVLLAVPAQAAQAPLAPQFPVQVCGQPVLISPWNYNGASGSYTSGTPGLPTFGAPGTTFPTATAGVVIPAGDNSGPAGDGSWQVNDTVFYFEPGTHELPAGAYVGDDDLFTGGYTAGAGKAVLSGEGTAGTLFATTPDVINSNDTWEYLTVTDFVPSLNSAVMGLENGAEFDNGNTYKYLTVGPNAYSQNSGGGYAIAFNSVTTIEYSCLTENAQGGFNGFGWNDTIANNEISLNGLGVYPDEGGEGGSPYSCGCSGGGKIFDSLNANIVNNYVHDNYNAGIWLDFDNAGAVISHNYIASNWSSAIAYEASYNADIADNTLTGNGWASHGAWPAGYMGADCYGGVPCTEGAGPISGMGGGLPIGEIGLSNSGGNASLGAVTIPAGYGCDGCMVSSRYSGELLVTGNAEINDFGGVSAYTDTNRYPGNIDNDSTCSVPLGPFDQANNALYYRQTKILVTKADTTITGDAVSSTGGTIQLCDDYGGSGVNGAGFDDTTVTAPSTGMRVYDQNSGDYLGTVATVASANSFTLSGSPGDESAASLLITTYGGCGPGDYYGGGLGVSSGSPSEPYWDNCIWGSRNVKVNNNTFSLNASVVTPCSDTTLCGFQSAVAFNAGVPALVQFFDAYPDYISLASGGLGNVWSDNAYTWSGGGHGGWQFNVDLQNTFISAAQWQAAPYDQDAGSTFG